MAFSKMRPPDSLFSAIAQANGVDTISIAKANGIEKSGGTFSPSDIAGLNLDLNPHLMSLSDNDAVASLTDYSGNGCHYSGSGTYKTNIVNGKSVIRFNGTTHFFSGPNHLSGLSEATILIVVKMDNDPPTTGEGGLWKLGSDSDCNHIPYTNGTIYDGAGSTVRKTTVDPTPSMSSAFRVYSVVTKSGEWTSYLDNSQLYTTGTNTVGWTTAPLLGATSGSCGGTYHDGDIARFLIYDSGLDSTNRGLLQTYLATEYGL